MKKVAQEVSEESGTGGIVGHSLWQHLCSSSG